MSRTLVRAARFLVVGAVSGACATGAGPLPTPPVPVTAPPVATATPPTEAAASPLTPRPGPTSEATTPSAAFGTVVGRVPSGRIVFGIEQDQHTVAIAWLDPEGMHVVPGTGDPALANASWLSTDTLVLDKAFGDHRHVFELPLAGGELVPLTHDPTTGEEKPSVSADGSTLAYEHYVVGSNEDLGIQVASPVDSTPRGLPAYADPITGGDKSVALSPDGSEVAFIRVPDWNHESAEGLFVRPTTAGHARRLTDDAMSAGYPRFSPDGTTILFTQGMDGGTHDGPLWTVPAAGGTPTPLRSPGDGLWAFEADWAPDGTRIVFKVLGPGWGHNELWTALADGSDPQPLWIGDTGMTAETPDWGPAPAP